MDEEVFEQQTPVGRMIYVDINREMRRSFLDYSMSVITARALPDVRDGLKPVHRRILYTMFENNLMPNVAYRKCADTVGTVLGRYHPHGDASVYDAMVRLAQDFSMRYVLVDGHGNFGSVDGDPPAAYRYTESRLSKISLEMLTDINKDTVDFINNYDDRLKEPTVLPSRIPNILVNGSDGIAVGMATKIPPHNLGEVVDAMCALIDDPDITLEGLMQYIKGPDFPTAGIIMGRAGIRAAYGTGRGKLTVRARHEFNETKNGRTQIIFTSLPYQVNKARVIESIAEHVKNKKIEGISDVNDYSNRKGMKIVVDLKRDANPQVVLNMLFKYTQLQDTYGVILLALVNGEPKILTLKQILQYYIDYQCEVITRRTRFDLKKAKERAHILEALLKALDFIDEVIAILRASASVQEGKDRLMERFGFDEVQANHIVQMRLAQLTGLERQKLEDEMAELRAKIEEYTALLGSRELILAKIREEATERRDKYADERRTEIVDVSGEVDIEELIPEEICVFTMTNRGYIKRTPATEYRAQRRGGRGVTGAGTREEDVVNTMFTCGTHDWVMFFTDRGRVFRLKGYEIPEGARNGKGMNIVNLLALEQDEKITEMLRVPKDESPDSNLCMITKNAVIKRTELAAFKNIRKSGMRAIDLLEGDELAAVRLTRGGDRLIVGTRMGMAILFGEEDVRVMGRTAKGVRAIRLKKEDDAIVGMDVVKSDEDLILTITENGYGKISRAGEYRSQSRGGSGVINYKVDGENRVVDVRVTREGEDLVMMSKAGVLIRIPAMTVRICGRPSKGVKVMRIGEGDRIVTVSALPQEEREEREETEEREESGERTETGGEAGEQE
ncbi:MAG: DNA gyrase subunit A [Clostridia bacterium]|nr:DNA gyrase subunit A [Clostridia bacterium]